MEAAAVEAAAVVAAAPAKQLVDAAPNRKERDSSRALSGAALPPSRRHSRLPRPPTAPPSSSSVAAPRAVAALSATGPLNKGVGLKKAAAAAAADALEAEPVATAVSELEAEAVAAPLAPVATLAGGSGTGSEAGRPLDSGHRTGRRRLRTRPWTAWSGASRDRRQRLEERVHRVWPRRGQRRGPRPKRGRPATKRRMAWRCASREWRQGQETARRYWQRRRLPESWRGGQLVARRWRWRPRGRRGGWSATSAPYAALRACLET